MHARFRENTKSDLLIEQRYGLGTSGMMPTEEWAFQIIQNGSLDNLGHGADVVVMSGNVGVINVLFHNQRYKAELHNMGLRPETAYGCALEYLFAPSKRVREHFEDAFLGMSSKGLKIGIQIRLGDGYLRGGILKSQMHAKATMEVVQHFFECATQLETAFRHGQQQVVWLLLADSLEIRVIANATYGEKVLVKIDKPSHVAGLKGQEQDQAMIAAAGEHWLFGMADYHVISSIGGFGRSAAMRSYALKTHGSDRIDNTVYKLDVYQKAVTQCDGLHTTPMTWQQIVESAPFV